MKLRAVLALTSLFVSTALIACGPPPNKNTAKKVGSGARDDNSPTVLADIKFEESPRGGDPKVVGCADGQREGFADLAKFPTIAGCLGVWNDTMTLRKGKTSKACGDDLDICESPADVCADGWHVCARDGDYHDLSDRVDAKQCNEAAGPGKFVAAISHVKKKKECAPAPGPTTRYPCLKDGWGAEPVCCGNNCSFGTCRDSVWEAATRISAGKAQGCGGVTSDRNGGILCCKDADTPKPTMVPAMPTVPEGAGVQPPTGADPTGPAPEGADAAGADKAEDKQAEGKQAEGKQAEGKQAEDKKAEGKQADE